MWKGDLKKVKGSYGSPNPLCPCIYLFSDFYFCFLFLFFIFIYCFKFIGAMFISNVLGENIDNLGPVDE